MRVGAGSDSAWYWLVVTVLVTGVLTPAANQAKNYKESGEPPLAAVGREAGDVTEPLPMTISGEATQLRRAGGHLQHDDPVDSKIAAAEALLARLFGK